MPPSHRSVREMAYRETIHGGLTNTDGSCPGCGASVPRVHAWSPERAREAYRCPRCGTFEYTTGGADLPSADRTDSSAGTRFAVVERAATLRTVLDPVDCVS